jgi:hypothetical protein
LPAAVCAAKLDASLLRNAGGLANCVPALVFIRHESPELLCRRAVDHHANRDEAIVHLFVSNDFIERLI